MIKILIVDDSPVIRIALKNALNRVDGFEVIGTASNGEEAIKENILKSPDIIIMDISMPVMDGLSAIKHIMKTKPARVLVFSGSKFFSSTEDPVYEALSVGAMDIIKKTAVIDPNSNDFEIIVDKIKEISTIDLHRGIVRKEKRLQNIERVKHDFDIITIGVSTGGPLVLKQILEKLSPDFDKTIVITQHMTKGFIKGLSDWLNSVIKVKTKIPVDGERLQKGYIYFAPDYFHIGVRSNRIRFLDSPPINNFKPSCDVMFEEFAREYGKSLLAIILTGMGRDGTSGLKKVKEKGGYVIAQDESTSVVYGMPKAALEAGVVDIILPANLIGEYISKYGIEVR